MKEWMNKFGWEENPFSFRIYPGLMVGYEGKIEELEEAIDANNKFSLVLGRTGAGKTNLLRWLVSQYQKERDVYYMPKPPTDKHDLLEYLKEELLQPGIFDRLFGSYSLYNIHHELHDAMDEPSLLVIDEGHEASEEVLEWIRTAIDHVDNLSVIAAGLPEFEDTLTEEVHTLYSRATNVLRLQSLNRDESLELVRQRIEKAGGHSLEPFTQQAIVRIYEKTSGFPREVLRACNRCVVTASRENLSIIDEDDVDRIIEEETGEDGEKKDETTTSVDDLNLTAKQEKVLDVLKEQGECTSGEVADSMGTESYTSRSHAVRSINNILKRLMENGVVDRERRGRSYAYFLNE